MSCNKSGSFKSRVNTDFSVLIGYNYKGVTQGTCLLYFRCGVCNDVFDSRVQQTSEQHSNGRLKGKKPNQKLMSWCCTGAGEKGKKEEIRERGTLFPFAFFSPSPPLPSLPPPLPSLPLFGACFACKKLMKFHGSMLLCLKLQLKLIMIKFVINSCAVL